MESPQPSLAVRAVHRETPGAEQGGQQMPDLDPLAMEILANGIDDEGTVGHDRLDHRAGAVPSLGGEGRCERAHPRDETSPGQKLERVRRERRSLLLSELLEVLLASL